MKKIYIISAFILCLLLCACSTNTGLPKSTVRNSSTPVITPDTEQSITPTATSVPEVSEIKVEPCAWTYQNGKEIMNKISDEIGTADSDKWNSYFPGIIFPQNQDNKYRDMIFSNWRVAVIYNFFQSSGKIINVKDFYPVQFNSSSDENNFLIRGPIFDICKNERYAMMYSHIAGVPIYVFDNENSTVMKLTLPQPKIAFFTDNSLYIRFAEKDTYLQYADWSKSVLYDPSSGGIIQTQFTERNEQEPPDLSVYKNIGDISSHVNSFIWDGTYSKDVITKKNNADPYKTNLYLYNLSEKTYCSEVFDVRDLVQ